MNPGAANKVKLLERHNPASRCGGQSGEMVERLRSICLRVAYDYILICLSDLQPLVVHNITSHKHRELKCPIQSECSLTLETP